MENSQKEIINNSISGECEFVKYVTEFYNDKDGIYPIATKSEIKSACHKFIDNRIALQKPLYFDTLDRETVRCILEHKNK